MSPSKSASEVHPRFGSLVHKDGVRFAVWSGGAERLWVCLFDKSGTREVERLELKPEGEGVHARVVPGLKAGAKYGFRAEGPYDPDNGLWFDPDKLLVDPYAIEIDRPYIYDPRLAARRGEGGDTAPLMPKAVTIAPAPVKPTPPLFQPGGLIYELSVRSFSMLHPDIPEKDRGTIRALMHPAVIRHLTRIGVSAVELMPVTAWIDERHLGPLGLTNAWGYNPVTFMALDPRLAPGGLADLRDAVAALRRAGIGVILDLVFNHTGESDAHGPTLSLRGLDAPAYYRHRDGRLVNDTGTGNTLACNHPVVQELVLDSLRHFVLHAGVDGFRFDLAPVLGRTDDGFRADAPLLTAMRADPVLSDRILIAEPWDIGTGGYQLGNFPPSFLEWNDKYRDDVRRFWRGDGGTVGAPATRLAGSSDVFASEGARATRSVNFIAAHDGMTLADIAAYAHKHNEANGEDNRDGHDENLSWNNGVEGDSGDAKVTAARSNDVRALLATLFASRGAIMLTAGDEFGRSQRGNNNAYAQDNAVTWLDWRHRDAALEDFVAALSAMRRSAPALSETAWLSDDKVSWLTETGVAMRTIDWEDAERRRLIMVLSMNEGGRLAVLVNGDRRACVFTLPAREGFQWRPAQPEHDDADLSRPMPGRAVRFLLESRVEVG
ncbi:glycogen debranching protein GlgX [Mesorhizobium sp. BE184]|uniref:glycogen debranching protein GlgX n=1 Tax=Mesorhizobium sp. BE184 TaxID=2817714 RepID=UPI00286CBD85|nr:glycogen debranching protein GlgX [Mesorhizobium sp. BE184]